LTSKRRATGLRGENAMKTRNPDLRLGSIAVAILFAPVAAHAQEDGILVQTTLPDGFDRGRNVSVLSRPRPDYDPLGIRAGGFMIYPRLDLGGGFSDNIYLSEGEKTADAFALIAPSVRAQSDWSRHQVSATGGAAFRRYFGNPRRNENTWNAGLLGRADIGVNNSVTGEVQAGKIFESPFSGEVNSTVAALSSYQYLTLSVRGQMVRDRNRFTLAYTRNSYDFNDVALTSNVDIDQSNRDRVINGVVGQAERAFSPSASFFGQVSYSHTDYSQPLAAGVDNRGSDGYRALAGVSIDLAAVMRGSAGIGYTVRNFSSPLYDDVKGLSVDARLEYFFSELTTFTLRANRVIQDSTLANTSAYFDNRASLQVDHELLRNLILGASGEFSYQDYIGTEEVNKVYRIGTRARYLISPLLQTSLGISYAGRNRTGGPFEGSLNEFRVEASVSIRP
jgi:hypothetical protein